MFGLRRQGEGTDRSTVAGAGSGGAGLHGDPLSRGGCIEASLNQSCSPCRFYALVLPEKYRLGFRIGRGFLPIFCHSLG